MRLHPEPARPKKSSLGFIMSPHVSLRKTNLKLKLEMEEIQSTPLKNTVGDSQLCHSPQQNSLLVESGHPRTPIQGDNDG